MIKLGMKPSMMQQEDGHTLLQKLEQTIRERKKEQAR